jgi:COP9 signalosome complex subunit 6
MSSSSGLTFKLHPLVIVNISDHYTRIKAQSGSASPPPRVYGCVLGVQTGRTVEIFNSFELHYDATQNVLDRAFLESKQEQYKKVFPKYDVLGWYSTGSDIQDSDMLIHKALTDINESPVYLLLNPAINHAQKDLPIAIFESEILFLQFDVGP